MLNIILEVLGNLALVVFLFGLPVWIASVEHNITFREELFAEDEDE